MDGMGGEKPSDLANDMYTWVDIKPLVSDGYSKSEAKGTFGSLVKKGFVIEYDEGQFILNVDESNVHQLDKIFD